MIQAQVPRDSVVIADAAVQQNLDYFGQWRLADLSFVLGFAEPRPAPAVPGPAPRQAIERPYRQLDASNRMEVFREDVWKWAGGSHRVFFAITEEQLDRVKERVSEPDQLREIYAIDLPAKEDQMSRGFPPGRGGPRGPGLRGRPRGAGPASGPGPPDPGTLLSGGRLMVVEWTRGG